MSNSETQLPVAYPTSSVQPRPPSCPVELYDLAYTSRWWQLPHFIINKHPSWYSCSWLLNRWCSNLKEERLAYTLLQSLYGICDHGAFRYRQCMESLQNFFVVGNAILTFKKKLSSLQHYKPAYFSLEKKKIHTIYMYLTFHASQQLVSPAFQLFKSELQAFTKVTPYMVQSKYLRVTLHIHLPWQT